MVDYQQRAAKDKRPSEPERGVRRVRELEARATRVRARLSVRRAGRSPQLRLGCRAHDGCRVRMSRSLRSAWRSDSSPSSGGRPARARRTSRAAAARFKIAIPVLYVGLGIAVPAIVLADGQASTGLRRAPSPARRPIPRVHEGKSLFRETCWSCHTLKAAGAMGVTGPNLDDIGAA